MHCIYNHSIFLFCFVTHCSGRLLLIPVVVQALQKDTKALRVATENIDNFVGICNTYRQRIANKLQQVFGRSVDCLAPDLRSINPRQGIWTVLIHCHQTLEADPTSTRQIAAVVQAPHIRNTYNAIKCKLFTWALMHVRVLKSMLLRAGT